jgi:hypothetical protein
MSDRRTQPSCTFRYLGGRLLVAPNGVGLLVIHILRAALLPPIAGASVFIMSLLSPLNRMRRLARKRSKVRLKNALGTVQQPVYQQPHFGSRRAHLFFKLSLTCDLAANESERGSNV